MIYNYIDNDWLLMLASKSCFQDLVVLTCVSSNGHKRLLDEKVVGGQLETAKVDIGRAVTYDEGVSRQG